MTTFLTIVGITTAIVAALAIVGLAIYLIVLAESFKH